MKRFNVVLLILFIQVSTHAQEYNVHAKQKDAFSQSLVQLLNAATTNFSAFKGDSIRNTSLMGYDYKLNLPIEGSHTAVVRIRDWDINAYVEFRGYNDLKAVNKGFRDLVDKIREALGDQLQKPRFYGNMTSLAIQDAKGFFSANVEVFAGSSSAVPYLLGPEKEPENGTPKQYFILLKVHSGIPHYQYYVDGNIAPPDQALHKTLQQLIKEAAADFKALPPVAHADPAIKKKRTDTISMNGYTVYINKRGQHYSASLVLDPAKLSLTNCHQAIQAALGSRYVFQESELMERKYTFYYVPNDNNLPPAVFLEHPRGGDDHVIIRIESRHGHQTKRGLDPEDID
jgi:hypothetical protein